MTDPPQKKRPRRRRRKRTGAASKSSKSSRPSTGASQQPTDARRRPRKKARSGAQRKRPRRDRKDDRWWARRWSASLDSIRVGRRVGHGRKYARQGRVVELDFDKGAAAAMVQGSRNAPYLVRMHFTMLPTTEWRRVLKALGENVELGSGLFRGEFPPGTEEAFSALGLPLFFSGEGDLKAACSCPDPANPCKHVAAVYYALGEEIARDPFLLFKLRGLDRAELMEALARTPAARAALSPPSSEALLAGAARREGDDAPHTSDGSVSRSEASADPLPTDPILFWSGSMASSKGRPPRSVRIPHTSSAIAQRLGGFPFWRGDGSSSLILDQIYRNASIAGLSLYLGEPDPGDRDGGGS